MKDRVLNKIKSIVLPLVDVNESKEVLKAFNENQISPIYHYHIRKTAGTSINYAFIKELLNGDVEKNYALLAKKYNHRLYNQEQIIVGWNKKLINSCKYSFAFSHLPYHKVNLKDKSTYTITCLRNPIDRLISHYNMLMHYKKNSVSHECMRTEGVWLGKSFSDFLNNVPENHLKNQLFMFSERMELNEAIDNISKLNKVLFTDNLATDLNQLGKEVGLNLESFNKKSYNTKSEINDSDKNMLIEMLGEEITFYNTLKNSYESTK